jgi:hypothetical protein
MARKKSNTKLVALGGLSIVVVTGLVIIFMMFPNILEEDVITTTTVEEIIEEGIEQGVLTIPIPCFEITSCAEGQPIISEEHETNPIEEIIDPTPVIEDPIEPELESIIIEEEVIDVDPITIEPIIEEPPPDPPTVEIVSNVTKIANNGERFTSSTSFNIPLRLELFVEDTTNIDFDQGFIENQLFLKTDAGLNVDLTGFFDILIENQTILTQPVPINVQGISDQDGMIAINFLSPTGISSEIFLFQFADHIDKFQTQGITKIEYKLLTITASIDEFNYGLDFETIFSMDIFRDPNLITITDEEGGIVRALPEDDNVRLCSTQGSYVYKTCSVRSVRFGCQTYRSTTYPISAPTVGAWTFLKQDKISDLFIPIDSGLQFSTSCPLNVNVQRDEVYRLQILTPNAGNIIWKTDIEQRNFLFSCINGRDPTTGTLIPSCNYDSPTFLGSLLPP